MNDKNRNNSTNSNNKSSSMIVGGGGGLSVEPYHLSPCKSHTDLSLQSKVSHTDYYDEDQHHSCNYSRNYTGTVLAEQISLLSPQHDTEVHYT